MRLFAWNPKSLIVQRLKTFLLSNPNSMASFLKHNPALFCCAMKDQLFGLWKGGFRRGGCQQSPRRLHPWRAHRDLLSSAAAAASSPGVARAAPDQSQQEQPLGFQTPSVCQGNVQNILRKELGGTAWWHRASRLRGYRCAERAAFAPAQRKDLGGRRRTLSS